MKLKGILTAVLLIFALTSLAYGLVREAARSAQAGQVGIAGGLDELKAGKGQGGASVFYATYYHGNTRCPTCVKIETFSKECFETRFAKEIQQGKLKFRIVNYEEKGNEHFWKDYSLKAQSLIVSEVKGGKELRWVNLEKVWDLTHDKGLFFKYVEGETRGFIKGSKATAAVDATAVDDSAKAPLATAAAAPEVEHKLIAYYLHGNTRCPSCLKIEAYTKASIEENFAAELSSGRIEWRVVNTDEPENRHFLDDYSLTTKSVVLSDTIDGQERSFKNLDRVWDLLSDEAEFKSYIAEETQAFLKDK
jgi:hypothetical protein